MKALNKQVGGNHYKHYKMQPGVFCEINNIPFMEGSIIKYACRWRDKNGVEDLKKIIHYAEMLIELRNSKQI